MKWDHKERTTDAISTVSEWGIWTSEWDLEIKNKNKNKKNHMYTHKVKKQNKQKTPQNPHHFPTFQTSGYFFLIR